MSAAAAAEVVALFYDIVADGIKLIWDTMGSQKPYVHMINFALDSDGVYQSGKLQDGDKIRIKRTPVPDSSLAVKCVLKSNMSWWKAVTVHTQESKFKYEIVYTQDDVRESTNNVEYREIVENFLVLSKAKSMGIHTNMYWIQNSYDMTPDYEWEITWQED